MNTEFLYHTIDAKIDAFVSLKKYGLCSPKCLYDVDINLFKKTSFLIYRERTAKYLNKKVKEVKPEDVIDYLDNAPSRKVFTSEAIFFDFLKISKNNKQLSNKLKPYFEIEISVQNLKKYTPIYIDIKNKQVKNVSWKYIQSEEFFTYILNEKPTKIGNTKVHLYIPHIAINAYNIPYKKLSEIKLIK